jgi:hypothetical protein
MLPPSLAELLATCLKVVSCLAYSVALDMEAACSSETSVAFEGTTRYYISEDKNSSCNGEVTSTLLYVRPFRHRTT